jgi:hypothetical protein
MMRPFSTDALFRPVSALFRTRVVLPALLIVASPTLFRDGEAATAAGPQPLSGTTTGCLQVGQTESIGNERFHRIANTCAEDLVIFYCIVATQRYQPEWSVGDCRAPKPDVLAAWNRRMANVGMIVLEAPKSASVARKANAGWLDGFREFGPGIGREDVDIEAVMADLGDAPLALYTTRAGEAFVSGSPSYNPLALRSVVVPDACVVDAYLAGKCTPDPVKVWNAIGRPMTAQAAIEAMRAAGMNAE